MSQFPRHIHGNYSRPRQSAHDVPFLIYNIPQPYQNARSSMVEDRFQFDFPASNSMPSPKVPTEEEKRQAVEDLIRVVSEWHEKLPHSIRSIMHFETAIYGQNEQLEEFKRKLVELFKPGSVSSSRGINAPAEDPPEKLERFRIRTVQFGGGEVKQEEVKQ